jgi:hypothetical protein
MTGGARHGPGDPTMSTRIVAAVAEATDCDPGEVQPLYTVLDPDVVDALFEYGQSPGWEGQLTVTLDGYRVTVTERGEVSVEPPAGTETGTGADVDAGADA